jgi:DNA-3-methyladenine glycosylase II
MHKYETIMLFVAYWRSHSLDFNIMTDATVRAQLAAIKGIEQWTIDMILLYTLQRPNIFPCDDFHLKAIMVKLYGLNPNNKLKAQLLDISEQWANQKSLAVLYLLAAKKLKTL